MSTRIAPAQPPFSPEVQTFLDRMMPPGTPPLVLFTTLARDARAFQRFTAAGLLDRGHLTMRQRELVIDRVTARCGSEYEWGVHVAAFGPRVELRVDERRSLVHGGPDDACWNDEERTLLRLCDSLHASCDVPDALWTELRARFSEPALLELLLLCGFYRTVSYLTNALRLPLEAFGERFPAA